MRNWTIAAIAIVLLSGSAWAQTSAVYRPVQEICLFSPFLAPADSPVALLTLKPFGDTTETFDVMDDLAASEIEQPNIFHSPGTVVAVANTLAKVSVLPGADWGPSGSETNLRILRTASDWTNFALSGGTGSSADENMTFGLSSVRAVGLERNGFVAGFNLKF